MAGIVSLLTRALIPNAQPQVAVPVRTSTSAYDNNPFVTYNGHTISNTYGKNQPVRGGYFAGYVNGKQNIVGQRLFIEV